MATAYASEEKIDIGRVVQRGFQSIGGHALAVVGLALLLVSLPQFLVYSMFPREPAAITAGYFLSFSYWLPLIVSVISGFILQATLVRMAILDLSGRQPDVGKSLVAALKLLLPMIGLAILSTIIVGLGFLLLIVPGIIAYIMLIVTVPVLVEERAGVIGSMKRSAELTKGSRLRIFLLLILFFVAYLAITFVATFLLGFGFSDALTVGIVVQSATAGATALLVAAMLASLYVELRTVREGATPEGLAAIFE